MSKAVKRATKEFKAMTSEAPPEGVLQIALTDESNILEWAITFSGPQGTPYSGGKFKLVVSLSEEYPNKAPLLRFATKIWHPSVAEDGKLCEGLLRDWSPTNTIADIIPMVMTLFADPGGHDVLNDKAAEEWQSSKASFGSTAAKLTKQYAQ